MKNSVLFVDMSHLFFPLMQVVGAAGYGVSLLGYAQDAAATGIACHDFSACSTIGQQRLVENQFQKLADGLSRALSTPTAHYSFLRSSGSFLPYTGKDFLKKFLDVAVDQMWTLESFDSFVEQQRPVLIVLRTEKLPYQRALIKRASHYGIPTLQVAHSMFMKAGIPIAGEYNRSLSSDFISVFGNRASQFMQEIGVASERIFPCGSPYWDHLYRPENRMSRKEACLRLGLDSKQPVVLLCTGYAYATAASYAARIQEFLDFYKHVILGLKQLEGGFQLIVRPHPAELGRIPDAQIDTSALIDHYRTWLAGEGIDNVHLALDSKVEAIRAADTAIVWRGSGIIPECMILGCPVIAFQPGRGYTQEDGIVVVDDLKKLPEVLGEVLMDPRRRREIISNQNAALPEINQGNDGQALGRLAELTLRLARSSKPHMIASSVPGAMPAADAPVFLDKSESTAHERCRPAGSSLDRVPMKLGKGVDSADSMALQAWKSAKEQGIAPKRPPDMALEKSSFESDKSSHRSDISDILKTGLVPTGRAVIDINRVCNARCLMCYYAFEQSNESQPLASVKQQLLDARARGNTSVDFTGGEPTIYPHMPEVIQFAESIGLHTCIISNGLALDRIKRLVDAGCREWLLSMHGFEEQQDSILRVKGAWDKINRTVNYLNASRCLIRVNCTLMQHNLHDLSRLAHHYLDFVRPRIVNFINFNPHYEWGNQEQSEIHKRLNQVQAKVSAIAPHLREALDLLHRHQLWANVRYFPFCQLKDYETHICNNPQVMFDPYEWDYGVFPKTVSAYLAHGRQLQENIGCTEGACGKCGILNVCGGLHKNYALLFGDAELSPYAEPSDYPYHFKKDVEADIVIPVYEQNDDLQSVLSNILQSAVPPYNLVVASRHQSAAKNRNYGLERSRSPYVIMCDDDIAQLPLGWNRALINILKENREILAVSARLMTADGRPGCNSANNFDLGPPLVEVPMIPTACCVFRRSEVRFDERYVRAGWEDTDFFLQLQERYGGKLAIANNIQVVHLNEEKNNGGAQNQENRKLFFEKWQDKISC